MEQEQSQPDKQEEIRNPDGTFKAGISGNLNGRPKGKTLKEFAREWYLNKTDEEKKTYLENLERERAGFAWEMAEGKAKQDVDLNAEITSKIINIDE